MISSPQAWNPATIRGGVRERGDDPALDSPEE